MSDVSAERRMGTPAGHGWAWTSSSPVPAQRLHLHYDWGHSQLLIPGCVTYLGVEVADQQDRVACPRQARDGDPACCRCCCRCRRNSQRGQSPMYVRDRETCRVNGVS